MAPTSQIPDALDVVVCPVCGARPSWLVPGGSHEVPGSRPRLADGTVGLGTECPGIAVAVRYERRREEGP